MQPRPSSACRRRLRGALLVVLLAAAVVAVRPLSAHLRAASLLVRFADEHARGGLADLGRRAVDEQPTSVETSRGPVPARLYLPRDVEDPPGVVLVHGVHRLGIDEPRLTRFSRAMASSGVVVLTPEVQELADYRVDLRSVETIGASSRALRARVGAKVGVMGMSFAGGLSLLAAADPRHAGDVGFVVAIGGYHDLARVSRFLATSVVERPDGTTAHLGAHGYGALVMIYEMADRFFAPEDVDIARDALRLWLWDERDEARARAEALSPASWAKVDVLFDGPLELLAPELLRETARAEQAMRAVSPRGKLDRVEAAVFLLHGAGDTVIPAAETQWLAKEVPARALRQALVSRAVEHVELGAGAQLREKWALVHFMAAVLEEAG